MIDYPSDQESYHAARRFRIVAAIAALVIGIGGVFYHYVEKLVWLNSFYLSVITLTTVGYGDITPQTDAGKLFTIFYVLIGVGIIGASLNILVRTAAERRMEKYHHRQEDKK